ncbi:MAG: tRNA pseudouridine(55) synthase TruB [Fibrobacter sp.]|nr:tRNA pseudouridine(55) synthase TruB [Fibrobacter sp.]
MAVSGFVLLDKAPGETSFKALFPLKKVFSTKRVGHAGTLDLRASGLIIAATGRATRLLPYVEAKDKCYTFRLHLGYETDTLEWDGDVVATDGVAGSGGAQKERHCEECEARCGNLAEIRVALESILPKFIGNINQVPPKYCAVKVDGHRASDWAERGKEVELTARPIHIASLKIVGEGGATEGCTGEAFATFDLECECSKGTYIRALGRDIAHALGTFGCVSKIRRHRIGHVTLERSVTAAALTTANLVPVNEVLEFPVVQLNDEQMAAIRNGNWIPWRTPIEGLGDEPLIFAANKEGEVLSFCRYEPGRIWPKVFLAEDQE